jgi:hypothetical protein
MSQNRKQEPVAIAVPEPVEPMDGHRQREACRQDGVQNPR